MSGLRIDRPCRVHKVAADRWEWKCLCSPAVWPCTGREATWEAAQSAADHHMTVSHAAAPAPMAAVIDLAAYRATGATGGARLLPFTRPAGVGGDAA